MPIYSVDRQTVSSGGSGNPASLYQRPLKVGIFGDSIGVQLSNRNGLSALWWASTELYPCEYETTIMAAVGGTSSSNLVQAQTILSVVYPAQIETLEAMDAADVPDLAFIQTFQNDGINNVAQADALYAYLLEFVTRALAKGVKAIGVCSRPPKTPLTTQASEYLNRKLDILCLNTEGLYFINTMSVWVATNAAHTLGMPWRGTAGTADAFSQDGTHPVMTAARAAAPLFEPLLRKYARPLELRTGSISYYNNTTYPYGNVLGVDGSMIGTLGQYNGVNNANVCGSNDPAVSFEYGRRWFLTDGNGVTATPSIVTGPDGYLYQRIDFSGTASADATVRLRMTFRDDVTTGQFVTQAKMIFSGVERVVDFGWFTQALPNCNAEGTGVEEIDLDGTFVFCSVPTTMVNSGFGTRNNDFYVTFASGATATGYMLCGRAGIFRVS
jgi:hypothetical protein